MIRDLDAIEREIRAHCDALAHEPVRTLLPVTEPLRSQVDDVATEGLAERPASDPVASFENGNSEASRVQSSRSSEAGHTGTDDHDIPPVHQTFLTSGLPSNPSGRTVRTTTMMRNAIEAWNSVDT